PIAKYNFFLSSFFKINLNIINNIYIGNKYISAGFVNIIIKITNPIRPAVILDGFFKYLTEIKTKKTISTPTTASVIINVFQTNIDGEIPKINVKQKVIILFFINNFKI